MKSCLNCKHFLCNDLLIWVNGLAQAEECGFYEDAEISRRRIRWTNNTD